MVKQRFKQEKGLQGLKDVKKGEKGFKKKRRRKQINKEFIL